MFDIFGFWAAVTVYSTVLLLPVAFILYWALNIWFAQVTSRKVANKVFAKIATADWINKITFFGKIPVNLTIFSTLTTLGAISWTVVGALIGDGHKESVLHVLSSASTASAPLFGYVGIIAVVYTTSIYVGKRLYKLSERVNAILAKVEDD